jgi:hypothetical protein
MVDDTVLPRLTAEDLKDLGVRFVGHRRKLLDAIASLRSEASAPTPSLSDALRMFDVCFAPKADAAQRGRHAVSAKRIRPSPRLGDTIYVMPARRRKYVSFRS